MLAQEKFNSDSEQSEKSSHLRAVNISQTSTQSIRESRPTHSKNLAVLLVEDNETNQIIAQGALKRAGYNVIIAQNGHEAISACRLQAFDMILMDIEMPQINGIEATQFIRAHPGPNQTSIIVALTAYSSASEKYTYQHSGVDHVLTKPFSLEALAPVLETHFDILSPPRTHNTIQTPHSLTVIDPKILSAIAYDHDLDDVEFILRSFWRVAEGLFTEIKSAQKTGNINALRQSAHALKGAAANVGLSELAHYVGRLGSSSEAMRATALSDIDRAMHRARKALEVFLTAMR